MVEAGFEVTEIERELERLGQRLSSTETPNASETARLELLVIATTPGRLAVTIEYLVPSACWRPYHTATLRGDRVTVRTDGCVWQNTGEDWAQVKLSLSTRRPSLGSNPPELDSDVLSVRPRSETVEVSARNQAVKTTGLGGEPPAAPELPGIDDAGEAVTLPAASEASTVPSDGRPHRVLLSSWEEITRTVKVRLSNLGTTAKALRVEERVPVSELDKVKVKVERRETTGRREPDADGFVTWPVELAAASQQTLTLRYELKKHTDVVGV